MSLPQIDMVQVRAGSGLHRVSVAASVPGVDKSFVFTAGSETSSQIAAELLIPMLRDQTWFGAVLAGDQISIVGPRGIPFTTTTLSSDSVVTQQSAVLGTYDQVRVLKSREVFDRDPVTGLVRSRTLVFGRVLGTGLDVWLTDSEIKMRLQVG